MIDRTLWTVFFSSAPTNSKKKFIVKINMGRKDAAFYKTPEVLLPLLLSHLCVQ